MKTQSTRFTKTQLTGLLSAYYNGTSYIGIEDADMLQATLPAGVTADPRGTIRKVGAGFTCPEKFFGVHTRNLDSITALAAAGAKSVRLRDVGVAWDECWWKVRALAFSVSPASTITWAAHGADPARHAFVAYGTMLPSGITTRTLYYIVNPTANTFQLSLTAGGAPISLGGTVSAAFGAIVQMSKMHMDGVSGLLDQVVATASAAGMDIIYDCSHPPASITDGVVNVNGRATNRCTVSVHATNFFKFLMDRYASKINYFEAWNEPNDTLQFSGTMTGSSNDLLTYTAYWFDAITLFSSTAKVITPSFNVVTGVAAMDAWLQTVNGSAVAAADKCHVFGFHPYRGGNVQLGYSNEILDQYIAVGNARMSGKEIWITEVGESYPDEAILWRAHAYAMARGVARMFWYDYDMAAGKGDMRLTSYEGLPAAYRGMITACAGQTIDYVNQCYDRRLGVGVGSVSAVF